MAIPIRHADPENVAAGARTFFVTSSIAGKRNLLKAEQSGRIVEDCAFPRLKTSRRRCVRRLQRFQDLHVGWESPYAAAEAGLLRRITARLKPCPDTNLTYSKPVAVMVITILKW